MLEQLPWMQLPGIHPHWGFSLRQHSKAVAQSWRKEEPQTQLLLDKQIQLSSKSLSWCDQRGQLGSSHSLLTATSPWNIFLSPWGTK